MLQLQQLRSYFEILRQINSDKDMKIDVKFGDKKWLALFDTGRRFNIVTENV